MLGISPRKVIEVLFISLDWLKENFLHRDNSHAIPSLQRHPQNRPDISSSSCHMDNEGFVQMTPSSTLNKLDKHHNICCRVAYPGIFLCDISEARPPPSSAFCKSFSMVRVIGLWRGQSERTRSVRRTDRKRNRVRHMLEPQRPVSMTSHR